jgi:hypothetical protein
MSNRCFVKAYNTETGQFFTPLYNIHMLQSCMAVSRAKTCSWQQCHYQKAAFPWKSAEEKCEYVFVFAASQLFNKRHGLLSLDSVTEFWRVIMKIKLNYDALRWSHNSKEMTIMNCLCTVSNVQVLSTNFSVTFNNPGQTVFRICACVDRFMAHSTIPKAIYIVTVDGLNTFPKGFKNSLLE